MKQTVFIAMLLLSLKLNAQTYVDSTAVIDSVQVSAKQLFLNKQLFSQELLKVDPTQNYAELLQKQTGIFIKSTGVGSLNTPSYKGLGTMHIPINIDGANMQSSMNGTMDLSLIDAFHFSGSGFSEQDNSQLGQSNLGSSLNLFTGNIKPQIQVNIGGNTQNGQTLGLKYGNIGKKWQYGASFSGTNSENNVDLNPYIGKDSLLENTAFTKASFMQSISYQSSKFGAIKNTLYFQISEREIPPNLLSSSDAMQSDLNLMMLTKYQKKLKRRWYIYAQNQVWKEQINFNSKRKNLDATSEVLNVNSTVQASKRVHKKLKLAAGLGNENAYYTATNLESKVSYSRIRAFYNASFSIKRLRFEINQQLVNFESNRFSNNASFNVSRNLWKESNISLRGETVYRLPTLNELYWYEPGFASGNKLLKPEEGKKIEVIFSRNTRKMDFALNPFIGVFSNMIAWQGFPEINPVNIQSVYIRGIEINWLYSFDLFNGKIAISTNVHYVKSTYNPLDKNDATYGKQLIYTPELTSNITVTYSKNNFGIYANEQIVGANYVASDNSNALDPYYLTELGGYYNFDDFRFGASISNLFNTAYFTIPNTPLVGRVIKINANYTLKIKPWKKT